MIIHCRFQRLLFGVAVLVISALAGPAASHTHVNEDGSKTSWYPHECCHDGDCRPVANVTRTEHGFWLTTVDGHTVLVGRNQVRRSSQDMRWHICIGPPDAVSDVPIITCIFAPLGT